jgi:hypothetical protein
MPCESSDSRTPGSFTARENASPRSATALGGTPAGAIRPQFPVLARRCARGLDERVERRRRKLLVGVLQSRADAATRKVG